MQRKDPMHTELLQSRHASNRDTTGSLSGTSSRTDSRVGSRGNDSHGGGDSRGGRSGGNVGGVEWDYRHGASMSKDNHRIYVDQREYFEAVSPHVERSVNEWRGLADGGDR